AQPPAPAQPAPAQKPPAIEVNDPLLTPVPQPPHMLASWRDALTLISARSSELHIAAQEVEKAEGLSRQALAGALPTLTATGTITHNFIRTDVETTTLDLTKPLIPGAPLPTKTTKATVPPTPVGGAELRLTQPILAPRVWYGVGTANRSVDAAKLRVEDQRRAVVAPPAHAT